MVYKAIPKLCVTRILNLLAVSSVITLTSAPILSIALMLASLDLPVIMIMTLGVGK